jgi:hypothetical protein
MFLEQAQERINRGIASVAVGEIVLAQGENWLTETSLVQGRYGGGFREEAIRAAEQRAIDGRAI